MYVCMYVCMYVGSPRHYVHIVLQGHCSLVRTVKSTSSQVIEIDAHKHDHSGAAATLLPGDFMYVCMYVCVVYVLMDV